MKILPNKSEKEILLSFINDTYSLHLDVDKTHFSKPLVIDTTTINSGYPNTQESLAVKNTSIGVWHDDYLNEVDFTYRRIHVDSQFKVIHDISREEIYIDYRLIPDTQPEKNQYLIQKAKEWYNLINFDKIDITVDNYIHEYSVTFRAHSDSLLYVGETIILLKKLETRLHLNHLNLTHLSGFTYPRKTVSDD